MDKIFYGGNIITMEDCPNPEAVVISDGIIKNIGKYDELILLSPKAQKIYLDGKTLMPSFIDAHSHFSAYANSLLQAPLDECYSFEEITNKLHDYINSNNTPKGQIIIAKGYDNNILEERKHPTKDFIDSEFGDYPVILQHKSGHMGVFSSIALDMVGITPETASPQGGKINFKDGFLEEEAFMEYMKKVPMPNAEKLLEAYKKAQEKYASYGITTIQEGMMVEEMIPFYDYLIDNSLLFLDVVAYSDIKSAKHIFASYPASINKYSNNLKIGGYKIFLDGSPQGRTAWMLEPYKKGDENGEYFGYGTMKDQQVIEAIEISAKNNMQILAHCNGDRACQQFIHCVTKSEENLPIIKTLRPVAIHSQLMNETQLESCKDLGIVPSFFVAHVYYWGDTHIKNFGIKRAEKISMTRTALEKNIPFTLHQDAPVI
ncbi:MAG: amidohydrolase family protein, partial [Oscillospiraceae bacterium]